MHCSLSAGFRLLCGICKLCLFVRSLSIAPQGTQDSARRFRLFRILARYRFRDSKRDNFCLVCRRSMLYSRPPRDRSVSLLDIFSLCFLSRLPSSDREKRPHDDRQKMAVSAFILFRFLRLLQVHQTISLNRHRFQWCQYIACFRSFPLLRNCQGVRSSLYNPRKQDCRNR